MRLLLDGQQRITSLYGIVRGEPPAFFDGDPRSFTDLYFHLGNEEFRFYQRLLMQDDPLWVDVSEVDAGWEPRAWGSTSSGWDSYRNTPRHRATSSGG